TENFVIDQEEQEIYSKTGEFELLFLLNDSYLMECKITHLSWGPLFVTVDVITGCLGTGGELKFDFTQIQKVEVASNLLCIYFGEVKE
ncbi:MAG: hypothetical protein ABFD07_08305, partial [Methanobacterium sp.]